MTVISYSFSIAPIRRYFRYSRQTGLAALDGTSWAQVAKPHRRGKRSNVNKTTTENLATEMRGEAFAYARYMLYAERARKFGNTELAEVLEKTAKMELLEYFADEADLINLERSDAEKRMDPIPGEPYEIETIYRDLLSRSQPQETKQPLIALRRFATAK